jgi:hypothetical protein
MRLGSANATHSRNPQKHKLSQQLPAKPPRFRCKNEGGGLAHTFQD